MISLRSRRYGIQIGDNLKRKWRLCVNDWESVNQKFASKRLLGRMTLVF